MPATSISDATQISSLIGACLVGGDSGRMLASEDGGRPDMIMVAALNTDIVKVKQNAIDELALNQSIEDILFTLEKQVHLIRPLDRHRLLFIYVALDKANSNLGMAGIQLKKHRDQPQAVSRTTQHQEWVGSANGTPASWGAPAISSGCLRASCLPSVGQGLGACSPLCRSIIVPVGRSLFACDLTVDSVSGRACPCSAQAAWT